MANDTVPPIPEKIEEPQFNPLDEPVNEKRAGGGTPVNTEGIDMTKPIEEPRFSMPPPLNKQPPPPKQPKREPFNSEMKPLNKKDTEMAASQMAKIVIQAYEWMHSLANKGLQGMVSQKKLNKLQEQGEINLNAMIDYDYGKKIRAGEFFQDFSTQAENLLSVSDEFKEEALPLLTSVLAKRGIGLTEENALIFLFGKDIAAKSIIFFQMKNQLAYMIESIKQATMAQFVQPVVQPTPPQQPQPQQPQQQPQPSTQQPQQRQQPQEEGHQERDDDYDDQDEFHEPEERENRERSVRKYIPKAKKPIKKVVQKRK